jgi:hypothetical protein
MSDLSPFGTTELSAIGAEPMTRIKVECTTSAKGEVNVSWSVSLEVPTWDEGDPVALETTVGRLDQLLATTALQAAGAKYSYIDHLATKAQSVEDQRRQDAVEDAEVWLSDEQRAEIDKGLQASGAKYAYIDHLANRGQVVEPTVTATDLSTAERLFGLTEMDGRPVTSPTQIIDGFDEV